MLLLLGLPVLARLLFLVIGPPYPDLRTDRYKEYERLRQSFQSELVSGSKTYTRLKELGLTRKPLNEISRFLFRINTEKYAEAFLELARHNLGDSKFSARALLAAMRLDQGWNGKQAAILFASSFSNEEAEAMEACKTLQLFEKDFAIQQLGRIKNETGNTNVKLACRLALGQVYQKNGLKEKAEEKNSTQANKP